MILSKETLDQMRAGGNFKTGKTIHNCDIVILLAAGNDFVYGYFGAEKTSFKKQISTAANGDKIFYLGLLAYSLSNFTEEISNDWGLGR